MNSYPTFFEQLSGNRPLLYQLRYHENPEAYSAIIVPTGLGKTDAVLADWLYRRPTTRLTWVLPGRALTRQLRDVVEARVKAAGVDVRVVELMGGSEDLNETLGPDEPAILIGTQDILMSGALNRRYARSPFRWPIDFALLNNDNQWVFDEVQLLGESLATSTQLAAFRERFGAFGSCPCVWLSATFNLDWLNTVDFAGHSVRHVEILPGDRAVEAVVAKRLGAAKSLQAAPAECRLPKGCAEFVRAEHQDGTLTLVIANTVARAREIHSELQREGAVLLHSRFRSPDREEQMKALGKKSGIVVSTQVIEAGIDVDAELMVTDVAPWHSLVQRFGRVNRYGERPASRIFWVDRPLTAKQKPLATSEALKDTEWEKLSLPYEVGEIRESLATLATLDSAAPDSLPTVAREAPYDFVLRRSDLMDLFDTSPDLSGNQIDVSRFVRCGSERDAYVAWREWGAKEAPPKGRLRDEELCSAPLGDLEELLKKHQAWVWDFTGRGRWKQLGQGDPVFPGIRVLVRSSAGCYDPATGWKPDSKSAVPPVKEPVSEPALVEESAVDDDPDSELTQAQSIAQHTDAVVGALEELLARCTGVDLAPYETALREAARFHDWGKAHPVFQQTLHNLDPAPDTAPEVLLAKQVRGLARRGHSRPHFRHELASAMAMLSAGFGDLAAYIAGAHHGKVRVSVRSMPGEVEKADPTVQVARGIHGGDRLFPVDLGGGETRDGIEISLAPSGLGGDASWTNRVLRLLEQEGPFRLAFLEMLLRAADGRGSASNGGKA